MGTTVLKKRTISSGIIPLSYHALSPKNLVFVVFKGDTDAKGFSLRSLLGWSQQVQNLQISFETIFFFSFMQLRH